MIKYTKYILKFLLQMYEIFKHRWGFFMEKYYSTRNTNDKVSFSTGVTRGLSIDGGLYVPESFSTIDIFDKKYLNLSYQELAVDILSNFLDGYTKEEVENFVNEAYNDNFETKDIVPLKTCDNVNFLELFRGPTLAFKDMALQILPKFMVAAARKEGITDEIVVLTATSGDTGKAALEGFANKEGIKIIVFFPTDGVSDVQKMQMITQAGANTHVVAIKGNFDDAQSGVKEIFNDKEFAKLLKDNGKVFSSANSINIGRLVPQIVYYFHGYFELVKKGQIKPGDKINIVVPTGNFGNILASYYGHKMGLPVNKFICASNVNNVLTDFLNTGVYDINRKFETTISPSMDILISSNLERFLESLSNKNDTLINDLMNSLKTSGKYELPSSMKEKLSQFFGGYTTDKETESTIKNVYGKYSYVIDTHTAVAYKVYEDYVSKTGDSNTPTLLAATASPFKFTRSVVESITGAKQDTLDDFQLINKLSEMTGLTIPQGVYKLNEKEVFHDTVIEVNEMKRTITDFLKLK